MPPIQAQAHIAQLVEQWFIPQVLVQLQLWDRFTVQVLSKALDGTVLGVKSVSNPFYGTRFTQKTVQNCTPNGGFLPRPAKMNCPLLLVRESYMTGGQ